MIKIDSFSFGSIVINGKKYRHDVIIHPDGVVERRKGGLWMFGPHSFTKKEVEGLKQTGAEIIIAGTGTNDRAALSSEAKSYANEAQLNLITLPSHEAVNRVNQLIGEGKHVAAILHITC
jgi:hypothetical protein